MKLAQVDEIDSEMQMMRRMDWKASPRIRPDQALLSLFQAVGTNIWKMALQHRFGGGSGCEGCCLMFCAVQ